MRRILPMLLAACAVPLPAERTAEAPSVFGRATDEHGQALVGATARLIIDRVDDRPGLLHRFQNAVFANARETTTDGGGAFAWQDVAAGQAAVLVSGATLAKAVASDWLELEGETDAGTLRLWDAVAAQEEAGEVHFSWTPPWGSSGGAVLYAFAAPGEELPGWIAAPAADTTGVPRLAFGRNAPQFLVICWSQDERGRRFQHSSAWHESVAHWSSEPPAPLPITVLAKDGTRMAEAQDGDLGTFHTLLGAPEMRAQIYVDLGATRRFSQVVFQGLGVAELDGARLTLAFSAAEIPPTLDDASWTALREWTNLKSPDGRAYLGYAGAAEGRWLRLAVTDAQATFIGLGEVRVAE
jgi:hypothetical protein